MNTKEEFDDYIESVFGAITDTSTFVERMGNPEELPASIGLISMQFSHLEDLLSETIIQMLQLNEDTGHIITAELSFKVKVSIFYSLYEQLKGRYFFNSFPDFEDEYFYELVKALNKCEELRNQVLHSTYVQNYFTERKIFRRKITAKQKSGLRKVSEEINVVDLLNKADFMGGVYYELEEFGIDIMKQKDL